MRSAQIYRKTAETEISVELNIDGVGSSEIDTGCGFLNHMLVLFSKHSRIDLKVLAKGDVEVDYHHLTEDVGIAIGNALFDALSAASHSGGSVQQSGALFTGQVDQCAAIGCTLFFAQP